MDCHNTKCYKYRHCWACEHFFGCKEKPIGTCFECEYKDCPELEKVVNDAEDN